MKSISIRVALSALAMLCLARLAVAQPADGLELQAARAKMMKTRGHEVRYTQQFDLSDLPSYQPLEKVAGKIRLWGSNYFTDSPLASWWEAAFRKFQPDVSFDWHLDTSEHAISGLIFGKSDLGPMGRQIMWDEQMAYQREFNRLPLGIVVVTGSVDVSGWNPAIGIFVNQDNPLTKLSLEQIDGIFGCERSGVWRDVEWDESHARGPEKNLRTWGQLGLTGKWADQPIHVYGYNLQFHFPQEITSRAFGGVTNKWNEQLREYANKLNPDGSFYIAGQQMLDDLSKDPYAIAYIAGGTGMKMKHTKVLELSVKNGGPAYALNLDNVRARTYPMYADVFFFLDREPGKPVDPKLKEFLRFILSRDGQELVMKDGKYLPLTPEVIREQRRKLE